MLFDGLNQILRKQVLAPTVPVSATGSTKGVDRQLSLARASETANKVGALGAGSITFVFDVGATAETWDASTTYLLLGLYESDDSTTGADGNWTKVTEAMGLIYDHNLTLTSSEIKLSDSAVSDLTVYALGYAGDARWVKATITEVGTQNTGTYIAVTVELGALANTPANNTGN